MTFAESEHPRATDGKFAEKTGGMPEVTLDSISVTDTTAVDRFLGRSGSAWTRYRTEQEELRKQLPEVLAERTREYYPEATGLVFETETLDDGRTVIGTRLIAVEGPERLDFASAPFIGGDFSKLKSIENDIDTFSSQAVNIESDWHEAATVRSNSGPNTQWEMKF
jgi:hypothetical protein